jgi:2-polyprenyl-6-hydroxyphenyl methylase/3-demethylubiquinone-9 3-methyltransferase
MSVALRRTPRRARNDPKQYEDLVDEWWRDGGAFAMLHWIARARAARIPAATRPGAVLVDLGCGGGVLAPYARALGYRHVGIDLVAAGLHQAATHGVSPVRADVRELPFIDACADVVSAGEILEHVREPSTVLAEAARILRPGGTLVLDTINATAVARFVAVMVAERLGGVAVRGIHDPLLFVPPRLVVAQCAQHGVSVRVRGLRPRLGELVRWLVTRRGAVTMVPTWSKAVLYQGWGVKRVNG